MIKNLLLLGTILLGVANNPWLTQQKSFQESPEYRAIRKDRTYPATVIPVDVNNDGFSDAWVMTKNKTGRSLEYWEQQPLSEQHPNVKYQKKCSFPLLKGYELKQFSIENLLPGKAPVAILITAENTPEEGLLLALAAHYQPGKGCKTLLMDKLVTRPYLADNEGRKVITPTGNREGYFIEKNGDIATLIREGNATPITFQTAKGAFDLLVSRERITHTGTAEGRLQAQRSIINMTPKHKLGVAKIKDNQWVAATKEQAHGSILQLTFGCPNEPLLDLSKNSVGTLILKIGNEQLTVPLGGEHIGANLAAWSNLTGSDPSEKYYHLLLWLKKPVATDQIALLFKTDQNKPFCLRQVNLLGAK